MTLVQPETEEKLILLCRLAQFVDGCKLYSREDETRVLHAQHIFKDKILELRKKEPLVLDGCDAWTVANFMDARRELEKLVDPSFVAGGGSDEWGKTVSKASSVLKRYVGLSRLIHVQLSGIAMEIAAEHGFQKQLRKGRARMLLNAWKQPSAKRPFHCHISSNSAGGGDLISIVHLLRKDWRIRAYCFKSRHIYPNYKRAYFSKDLVVSAGQLCLRGVCSNAMEISADLESLADIMEEVHEDLVGWMALPCCMALHARLGGSALLGTVGVDVMKLIVREL